MIIGSAASLAANVAVADSTMWSRIIHAWPSFALIGVYELFMRAFRTVARSVRSASADDQQAPELMSDVRTQKAQILTESDISKAIALYVVHDRDTEATSESDLSPFQARAWKWVLER